MLNHLLFAWLFWCWNEDINSQAINLRNLPNHKICATKYFLNKQQVFLIDHFYSPGVYFIQIVGLMKHIKN